MQEAVVDIEYTLAIGQPEPKGALIHDDWVSCIHSMWKSSYCFTAGYDGVIRLWDTTQPENALWYVMFDAEGEREWQQRRR